MNIRFPKSLRIIALSLVAIGILALALSGVFTSFSRWIVSPLTSVQTWVSLQYQGVENFVSASQDIREIRQQNTELEAENARMQAQIVRSIAATVNRVQDIISLTRICAGESRTSIYWRLGHRPGPEPFFELYNY